MGCQGSRNRQDDVSNRPGYIAFDVKTIQYLKVNESEIKSKLRERCEQKLANKKQLTHSTSIRSVLRRSRLSTEDSDLKSSKSRQSLKDSSQMVESVVDQVVKYAVNDYKLNTQMSVDQLVKDIIKQGTSSSPENTLTTDSNNNSVSETTDNRFYKKTLNVALDELDMYLQENSLVISEFEMPVVEEQEPVMKLKDALELARQMFYEGKYSTIFSNKLGGYIVREATKEGHCADSYTEFTDKENGIERVTSFVSEAKQLKAKYAQTPVTINQ